MKIGSWWMYGVALAVAGGAFVYHRLKSQAVQEIRWPRGKNFGKFPPEIPESVFDEVSFL